MLTKKNGYHFGLKARHAQQKLLFRSIYKHKNLLFIKFKTKLTTNNHSISTQFPLHFVTLKKESKIEIQNKNHTLVSFEVGSYMLYMPTNCRQKWRFC